MLCNNCNNIMILVNEDSVLYPVQIGEYENGHCLVDIYKEIEYFYKCEICKNEQILKEDKYVGSDYLAV